MVPKFSAVRFLPFLAHMRPFSVIFWVLEVGHRGPFLHKYAPGSDKGWEKKKICCYIKNEHVTATFVNLIFKKGWGQIVKLLQLVDSFLLSANQKPPFLL